MNIEEQVQELKNSYTDEYDENHSMCNKRNQGELTRDEDLKEKLKEGDTFCIKHIFSDIEIIKILKENLVVVADTREQKNQHILEYFAENKIRYEKKKIDAGDYSVKLLAIPGLGIMKDYYLPVMIEKKNSVDELVSSIKDRDRFSAEFERATKDNTKIYLLVEQANGYEDIINNKYRSEYKPKALLGSLKTFESRYNFTTFFLDRALSGDWIYKTLYYYLREYLKNLST